MVIFGVCVFLSCSLAAILLARSSPPWVSVDRPFLFLIRHNPTGTHTRTHAHTHTHTHTHTRTLAHTHTHTHTHRHRYRKQPGQANRSTCDSRGGEQSRRRARINKHGLGERRD